MGLHYDILANAPTMSTEEFAYWFDEQFEDELKLGYSFDPQREKWDITFTVFGFTARVMAPHAFEAIDDWALYTHSLRFDVPIFLDDHETLESIGLLAAMVSSQFDCVVVYNEQWVVASASRGTKSLKLANVPLLADALRDARVYEAVAAFESSAYATSAKALTPGLESAPLQGRRQTPCGGDSAHEEVDSH